MKRFLTIAALSLVALTTTACSQIPAYRHMQAESSAKARVIELTAEGQAQLAKAKSDRQVIALNAQMRLEAAKADAQREVIRAEGMRIGSSFPEPLDRRMLATWLSFDDFAQLTERSLLAPRVGHMIVYGMSANRESLWDNRLASSIGYVPKDSADDYRDKVLAEHPPLHPNEPAARYHGGNFAGAGHFEDPK